MFGVDAGEGRRPASGDGRADSHTVVSARRILLVAVTLSSYRHPAGPVGQQRTSMEDQEVASVNIGDPEAALFGQNNGY
jgi:hypothetical protein